MRSDLTVSDLCGVVMKTKFAYWVTLVHTIKELYFDISQNDENIKSQDQNKLLLANQHDKLVFIGVF